jgi:RecB family exonuclease
VTDPEDQRAKAFDLTTYPWPPAAEITGPITPSLFEVARVCAMRAAFRAAGYPRRLNVYALVGTAFHDTLQHLGESDVQSGYDESENARAAIREFLQRVDDQFKHARLQPRWKRNQTQPQDRIILLRQAIGLASKRLRARPTQPGANVQMYVERWLVTRDGCLGGRPDRIDVQADHGTVIDFKTGHLRQGDQAASYERQLLFYAILCEDNFGVWPERGILVNPAFGMTHEMQLDQAQGELLSEKARALRGRLSLKLGDVSLATPGAHCKACDYRPWCGAYWEMASEDSNSGDHVFSATEMRVSGTNVYVKGRSRTAFMEIEGKSDLHPGLICIRPGAEVRILDSPFASVGGVLSAELPPRAEVFVLPAGNQ